MKNFYLNLSNLLWKDAFYYFINLIKFWSDILCLVCLFPEKIHVIRVSCITKSTWQIVTMAITTIECLFGTTKSSALLFAIKNSSMKNIYMNEQKIQHATEREYKYNQMWSVYVQITKAKCSQPPYQRQFHSSVDEVFYETTYTEIFCFRRDRPNLFTYKTCKLRWFVTILFCSRNIINAQLR